MTEAEPTRDNGTGLAPRGAFALGLAIVFVVAAIMMGLTWLCWPDVLIDSGRELYVPWRLAQGSVLYRDVEVFNGPLSPYINALWFRIVGVGVHQLLFLNGVVLASVLALLYAGAWRIGGFFGAVLGGVAAAALFAFGQVISNDGCNFMLPYSHEITHGMLLLLVMMACVWRFESISAAGKKHAQAWLCGAAFCLGLLLLTKVELFVAAAVTLAAAVSLYFWHQRATRAFVARALAMMLCAMLTPPLVAWLLLSLAMPAGDAMRGMLGSWMYVGNDALRSLPYFAIWMGSDDIGDSLRTIAAWTACYAWLGGAAMLAAWGVGGTSPARRIPAIFVGVVALLIAIVVACSSGSAGPVVFLCTSILGTPKEQLPGLAKTGMSGWLDAGRPMPVLVFIAILAAGWGVVRTHRQIKAAPSGVPDATLDAFMRREIFVFAAAVLSLTLMLKMILFARSWHYGFALGMPAGVFCFAVAGGAVPRIMTLFPLGGGQRGAWVMRTVVAAALVAVIVAQWRVGVAPVLKEKNAWIGVGSDRFRTGGRGAAIAKLIEGLNANVPRDATLAVLPEGAFVNFLTRRPNPTPYTFLLPSDLIIFGEDRVVAAYQQHPPDVIALVDRNTIEYGAQYFGNDYGLKLRAWIAENYVPIGQIGGRPFTPGEPFGVLILRRHE